MTLTERSATDWRWVRSFKGPESFDDDLGHIGQRVGPRLGPTARTRADKEEYSLRRLLVAWKLIGKLEYPFEVYAEKERPGEPDFRFDTQAGNESSALGIEVTDAGSNDYQKRLTESERSKDGEQIELLPGDGFVGDEPERSAAKDVVAAIEKKVKAFDDGKYRDPAVCDLVVYDNTETGWFSSAGLMAGFIKTKQNELTGRFRQIHLITGRFVFVDLFGTSTQVDVSRAYESDLAGWADAQAAALREGRLDEVDYQHVAEEVEALARRDRRSLKGHLQVLLVHLLKVRSQPSRMNKNWLSSIAESRAQIEQIVSDSPSLGRFYEDVIGDVYERARRQAAREMSNQVDHLPGECPFGPAEILDDEFLPRKDRNDVQAP